MICFYLKENVNPAKYGFQKRSDGVWFIKYKWNRIHINKDNRICFDIPRNDELLILFKMWEDKVIEVRDKQKSQNPLKQRIEQLEKEIEELKGKAK